MAPLVGKLMTNAASGNRAKRARVYFRLMDIVLVLSLLGFAEFLLDKVGGIILLEKNNPFYSPVSLIFVIANFYFPMLLILCRFMRDEYAELLWQRTATVIVYFSAIAPFLLTAVAWASFFLLGAQTTRSLFQFLKGPVDPFDVVTVIWAMFMLLFVAIFQFLRWRDSR
jgi:hypothetical protein